MDFPMYENMRTLIDMPYNHYVNQIQALINDRWDNSTQNNFNVWQEKPFASGQYELVDVSIDTGVDIGTGYKKGEDFKIFSHKDISHEVQLGTMFKTDADYWICINTNAYASAINSCEVRRCNNILKWINPDNGYVYQQWCVIEYELSKPQPSKDKDVVVANGHISIIVQGNDLTRAIHKNQRFIFNGQPYKLAGFQTLLDDHANQTVTNLIYMDMYLDLEKPSDDLYNMIANAGDYVYTIDLHPDFTEQVSGFVGKMDATVYLNGDEVQRNVVWTGNDRVRVDEYGNYTLIGAVDDIATITATLEGNPMVFDKQSITIVESIDDNYEIVISPIISEVRLQQPQSFSVYLYNNGVQQNDNISVVVSGLDESYYTLTQHGYDFILSARKVSSTPLKLTFTSNGISQDMNVSLKSFF